MWPAVAVAVVAAGLVSLAFQAFVLRALRTAAPIVRVIATIGLLGLLQAVVAEALRRRQPAGRRATCPTTSSSGAASPSRRSGSTWSASPLAITVALWAWTRYTRIGLAINASAQNERAVQTLGWSPDRLAALTWTVGGMLGGLAAVLAAPLTGLSAADVHDRGHRGRPRRRPARRLPLVPADARRRPDHRRRRGDGHPLRRRHPGLPPPGPHHRPQPHAGVPRDLPRGRRARPRPAAALARRRPAAEARHRRDQHPGRARRLGHRRSSCCSG